MNSRQRMLTALSHQQADKVPIDLGSTIVTTITRTAYQALRVHLGLGEDAAPVISHRQMDTVYPQEDLLRRYQVDARPVHLKGPWEVSTQELPDGSFVDEYHLRWAPASYYYDVVDRPLANAQSPQDVEAMGWPDPHDPGRVHGVRQEAQALHARGEHLVVGDIMCLGPFEGACLLRGHENFLVDLYHEPRLAEALLDRILEIDIQLWDAFLTAVGDCVQVVAQGDDIGMQTNLFLSPEMYRRYIKPRHKRLYDFIHSRTKAKVFMHSCGSIYDVVPDLIEVGVDILNPIQRSAAKMDITALKKNFGKELTFWGGGIDVQQVLPYATPAQIRDEVKGTMDIMAPGGGFVFVPSHNIQADVAPEKIDALYMAALDYR